MSLFLMDGNAACIYSWWSTKYYITLWNRAEWEVESCSLLAVEIFQSFSLLNLWNNMWCYFYKNFSCNSMNILFRMMIHFCNLTLVKSGSSVCWLKGIDISNVLYESNACNNNWSWIGIHLFFAPTSLHLRVIVDDYMMERWFGIDLVK
jgi:hypothetical protein